MPDKFRNLFCWLFKLSVGFLNFIYRNYLLEFLLLDSVYLEFRQKYLCPNTELIYVWFVFYVLIQMYRFIKWILKRIYRLLKSIYANISLMSILYVVLLLLYILTVTNQIVI